MNKENELLKKVTSKLKTHHLTGRALDDGCTDGYDVEYVLLAQEIVSIIKGE